MLTAILTIIILSIIAIIILLVIIALCKSASTYSTPHKCVGCKTEVHNAAPCGWHISRDRCTECYNIKIRCKYRDMEGQELD